MSISTSMLSDLLQALPNLRPQIYFKASLTALSHAMEDQVLSGNLDQPLVIASFQRERFYRQEAHRYWRLAQGSNQIYVLAAPETDFTNSSSEHYEKIAFKPEDTLSQEWHLVVIAQNYATCLVCRESPGSVAKSKKRQFGELNQILDTDTARRFEGIWTAERGVSLKAAELMFDRILFYRPELAQKVQQVCQRFGIGEMSELTQSMEYACDIDTDPFVQRLLTYLQASQYKLHKAYRSIAAQARKERLVNIISTSFRRSLNPQEILTVAAQELGKNLEACRCLIYRAQATDTKAIVEHEFLSHGIVSVLGQPWLLKDNDLFQEVVQNSEGICIADTQIEPRITGSPVLLELVEKFAIRSWLIEPVLYQGRLLGIVELHYCRNMTHDWQGGELDLVKAIATSVGVALIQAEAYANVQELNQQLEALDRTRSNLIAITGHELRTPLSTIQVCLESLASEPDMPLEMQQIMLNTALSDSERMQKLVQDFLTLSNLESGRVQWHPESLALQECIDLALSRIRARAKKEKLPKITTQMTQNLPLVRADGDWLVEVLAKLLDNACKFTQAQGKISIQAKRNGNQMVEVTISDNGRGIEPNRLKVVFDRFYQEEGALRRTTGGTGLGLAICRQIVNGWGGDIWAESNGKDRGSKFHFTVPSLQKGNE